MTREIPFETALRSMKVFVNLRGNFEDKQCWEVVYDFIKLHADLSADPIIPTPKIKHTPLPKPSESTPKNIHRNAPNGHIWLNVPFERKDFAKSYGARWNPQEKKWYFDGILPVELDQFLPNQSSIQTPTTCKKVDRVKFDWCAIDEALNGKEKFTLTQKQTSTNEIVNGKVTSILIGDPIANKVRKLNRTRLDNISTKRETL